jgi:2,3-bisphosphoglycerate-independent phosphoglycerate mutase
MIHCMRPRKQRLRRSKASSTMGFVDEQLSLIAVYAATSKTTYDEDCMSSVSHPIMLLVLDGWGHSDETEFNAIHCANTRTWDRISNNYPNLLIHCSGSNVGLPDEQMGNSEVGHMHLGAGRTVKQDFTRISEAVADGTFHNNPVLKPRLQRIAAQNKALHIIGLLSPGGVHSHEDHIFSAIEFAAASGVKQIYFHAILDGRDTPPRSAADSLEALEKKFEEVGVGRTASVVGRYFAMDRNDNWDRIEVAFDLIVDGRAPHQYRTAAIALDDAYNRGESDEFVTSSTIVDARGEVAKIEDGDSVFFANFRSDRARQLSLAFADSTFNRFRRRRVPQLHEFVTMTSYGEQFNLPTAFEPTDLSNTYGDWVAAQGLRQLRIAETEKYAHVTFFFNGGREKPCTGEDRILIPSPDVATYDLKPEMSAFEVTDALVEAINGRTYDTIICNFANADMVGHTGNFEATTRCIECLDACLDKVIAAARLNGMELLITADHGNAEKMRNVATDQAHTAHTTNLVPLIYIGREAEMASKGCLSDIAPTMLALMGIEVPNEMTGNSLVLLKGGKQQAA